MGRVDYIKSLFSAILLAPRQAFDEILHALCSILNFCLGKYNDRRGDFWRATFLLRFCYRT